MPIGDRSLSLIDDEDDRKKLQRFLNMVPRYLRTEIDELFVRIHPIPTIEVTFFFFIPFFKPIADSMLIFSIPFICIMWFN
jgi:hypothetical protein